MVWRKRTKKKGESTAHILFYYKMLSSLFFLIHNKFKPPSNLWDCLFMGFRKFFFFQSFRAVLFDGEMCGVIATTPVFSNTALLLLQPGSTGPSVGHKPVINRRGQGLIREKWALSAASENVWSNALNYWGQ